MLGSMLDHDFWLLYAEKLGIVVSDDEMRELELGAARILNRIGIEGNEDGCPLLEPPDPTEAYGTTYTKTYYFNGASLPSGWTIEYGQEEFAGVGDKDYNFSSSAWNRLTQMRLNFLTDCFPEYCAPTWLISSSPITNAPYHFINFLSGANQRLWTQSSIPDLGTFVPELYGRNVDSPVNVLRILLKLDNQVSEASLLGSSTLVNCTVRVKTTGINPLP